MSIELEIPKKPEKHVYEEKKVTSPKDIFNLKEVQEIKDAAQEHLLFVGLDRANNVRNITLLGVGTSGEICLDKHMSNVTNKLLNVFNIEFLDHIIVAEKAYISMGELGKIDRNYRESKIDFMDKSFLIEENNRLQEEIKKLRLIIERECSNEDEMEEF